MFGRSRRPGHPYLAGAPLLIAHRGGAGLAPENTLAAFYSAVSQWEADVLELDLRTTRDGELVVFHDSTVDRTTNGTGLVAEMSFEQLRDLDAGHHFTDPEGDPSYRGRGVRVPSFREVLNAFPGQRINAELKEPAAAKPFLRVVSECRAVDRVLLASIHEGHRTGIRDIYPGPQSASRSEIFRFWALGRSGLGRWADPKVDVLQLPEYSHGVHLVTRRNVELAHRVNTPVHVWTVNEVSDMHRMMDLGVDGIMSDRPDRLARVLHERVGRPLRPGSLEVPG